MTLAAIAVKTAAIKLFEPPGGHTSLRAMPAITTNGSSATRR